MKTPTLQELLKQLRERFDAEMKPLLEEEYSNTFSEVWKFVEPEISLAYSQGREAGIGGRDEERALWFASIVHCDESVRNKIISTYEALKISRTAIESLREKK